jgi:hypothetical protein
MIIPIFTFIVSSCVIPEKYKKEIESKCFKFIWNGKPDKVKRNTLIGDFEKGGLKMIDIESYFIALKASWVSRLTDSKFSNWKLIPLKYLNVFGKKSLIFNMNIDVKKHKQFLNNSPEFKIAYQCISFNLIWFPIPYKFKTLTLYLFFVFFRYNT